MTLPAWEETDKLRAELLRLREKLHIPNGVKVGAYVYDYDTGESIVVVSPAVKEERREDAD